MHLHACARGRKIAGEATGGPKGAVFDQKGCTPAGGHGLADGPEVRRKGFSAGGRQEGKWRGAGGSARRWSGVRVLLAA